MSEKFILVCTTQDLSPKFDRFITSLINQSYRDFIVYFALQDIDIHEFEARYSEINFPVRLFSIKKTGLSSARNFLLQQIKVNFNNINYTLSFPDDDCWYAPDLLLEVDNILSKRNFDFLFLNVYDPIASSYYGNRPNVTRILSSLELLHIPISVGIFIRNNISDINEFNEYFGVGTDFGSGEETIFLLDNGVLNKNHIYMGKISIFHEIDKDDTYLKMFQYAFGYGVMLKHLVLMQHISAFLVFVLFAKFFVRNGVNIYKPRRFLFNFRRLVNIYRGYNEYSF